MALVCRDSDDEPTFFGGYGAIATALGVADDPAGRQAVKRSIRQLGQAGALTRTYTGHAGKRSEYRVNVRYCSLEGGHSPTPSGGHSVNERGSLSDPIGGHSPTPQGDTGTNEENWRRNRSRMEGNNRAAVDKSRSDEKRLQLLRDRVDREGRTA